jgi:hypothetical protein
MFKTILVPLRGDGGDMASLGTAFAAATPFDGHIGVVHVQSTLPMGPIRRLTMSSCAFAGTVLTPEPIRSRPISRYPPDV